MDGPTTSIPVWETRPDSTAWKWRSRKALSCGRTRGCVTYTRRTSAAPESIRSTKLARVRHRRLATLPRRKRTEVDIRKREIAVEEDAVAIGQKPCVDGRIVAHPFLAKGLDERALSAEQLRTALLDAIECRGYAALALDIARIALRGNEPAAAE